MAEVIFPCTHMNNYNYININNLSEKCLKINMRYTYQTFELLYYIDVDGRELSTPYLPSPTFQESDLIDPFCPDCQQSFLEFFKPLCGHNYALSVLEHLCAAVNRCADNLVKQKAANEDEGEGGVEEYRFTFWVKECIRRPFTEEELMEWVSDTTSAAGLTPAAESAIEALQTVGPADVAKDESCTVCLEELVISDDGGEDDVNIKRLPCQHVFHADCIATWLRTSHVCPLCRYELEVHQSNDDNDNDGEQEEEVDDYVFDDAIDEDDDGELFWDAADDYIFSDDDDEAYDDDEEEDDEDEQEQEDEQEEDDEDEEEQEEEQEEEDEEEEEEEEKYNCGELSWVIYYDQLDM